MTSRVVPFACVKELSFLSLAPIALYVAYMYTHGYKIPSVGLDTRCPVQIGPTLVPIRCLLEGIGNA